ncbi:Trm44p [Sugiyamaella lignohabitans]|uniref:tRNA (uracil-O(2)-)-methyltransferase n=1 Tax=Sugiyamaella lignohabitans TaxID=796027 RepID=A0A167FJ98_9ASCO|nr:Trm44p [Sugiyamaella lignohabitans]ANB15372.1 Trm44p [Sugiyamaella lignohabitans]
MTFDIKDIRHEKSLVGTSWQPVYSADALFARDDFEKAMLNIIRHPNVNSTVIMRADILNEVNIVDGIPINVNGAVTSNPPLIDPIGMPLTHNLEDIETRDGKVDRSFLTLSKIIIRRIVPRNPLRDAVINQSCLVFTGAEGVETMLVAYIPHLLTPQDCPFYLPPVEAVGILYHKNSVSLHYILFGHERLKGGKLNISESANEVLSAGGKQKKGAEVSNINHVSSLTELDDSDRSLRIALHLLQTCHKHSSGVMNGYKKRVNHDLVVEKVAFQDRYMDLKQRYAKELVANWAEQTDPKKHVFEDLAIAAFLIELWAQMYPNKKDFCFYDLGCGNGLLVHILISEGFQGKGIDARTRKSWATYPPHVQSQLKEQVIIPEPIFHQVHEKPTEMKQEQNLKEARNQASKSPKDTTLQFQSKVAYTYDEMKKDSTINLLNLPPNAFVIGNHSDELTVWIPLLGFPFVVIPCCSHSLSGAKYRFAPRNPKDPESKSSYASLVDHVEDVATQVGWKVEKEMLRIPSTRNAAIIGRTKTFPPSKTVNQIIVEEGGTDGWIERTMSLRSKSPRNH